MALNPKQQRFVDEYLIDLNATQAAIRSGYASKNADVTGPRLLGNVGVRQAIDAKQAKGVERLGLTREYVLQRLQDNLERAMQAEPVTDREGNKTGEYVYQGSVANRSLELLGKHLGMFVDRSEVEVKTLPAEEREQRVMNLLQTAKRRKQG